MVNARLRVALGTFRDPQSQHHATLLQLSWWEVFGTQICYVLKSTNLLDCHSSCFGLLLDPQLSKLDVLQFPKAPTSQCQWLLKNRCEQQFSKAVPAQ